MLTITIPLIPSAVALLCLITGIICFADEGGDAGDGFMWIVGTVSMFFVTYGVCAMVQHGFGG